MMFQPKMLIIFIVVVALGLLLGLAIGWFWWPVEWYNTTPASLRPDFQGDYLLWVADEFATNGDVEWARSKLDLDSWRRGQLHESLERLALERGGDEALRLLVLSLALEGYPDGSDSAPVTQVWPLNSVYERFGFILLVIVFCIGTTLMIITHNSDLKQTVLKIPLREVVLGIQSLSNMFDGPMKRWIQELARFLSNWQSLLASTIIGFFVVVAIAAPWLAPPADPDNPLPFKLVDSHEPIPLPPGEDIPLGTAIFFTSPEMLLHYDVYYSLIWGTRAALRFGLVVVIFSASFGVLVGAVSGYIGGFLNSVVMRITDGFLAFPLIAAVWLFQQLMANLAWAGTYYTLDAVVAPLTARQRIIAAFGLEPVMLAFILFSWMPFARMINANVLLLKNTEYVLAAKSIGLRHHRIIMRHIMPNAIAPVIVLIAKDIGGLVILQAAFAFIGIGGTITGNITEWNRLLVLGRTWIIGVEGNLLLYWWLYIPVTLALVLFGVGWNLLGDRLNDMMNPWGR